VPHDSEALTITGSRAPVSREDDGTRVFQSLRVETGFILVKGG
jgi:hypothetical protein